MLGKLIPLLTLPALVLLAARGGSNTRKPDDALQRDLSLASQSYPNQPYASPMEQGHTNGSYAATRQSGSYRATSRATRRTVYRSSPAGTVRPTHVVKNTKRDAAIGAVAGGLLGAVTSRNKVAGAVIGAVAGGILGAVIGNNVDKQRVP